MLQDFWRVFDHFPYTGNYRLEKARVWVYFMQCFSLFQAYRTILGNLGVALLLPTFQTNKFYFSMITPYELFPKI